MDKCDTQTFEYRFCKNKYDHPIMYTRRIGSIKWNFGYPYSVDGLVELESGTTNVGREIIRLHTTLVEKYELNK